MFSLPDHLWHGPLFVACPSKIALYHLRSLFSDPTLMKLGMWMCHQGLFFSNEQLPHHANYYGDLAFDWLI